MLPGFTREKEKSYLADQHASSIKFAEQMKDNMRFETFAKTQMDQG